MRTLQSGFIIMALVTVGIRQQPSQLLASGWDEPLLGEVGETPQVETVRQVLQGARVVTLQDGPADERGRFHRTALCKANLKYPLIRMEQVVQRDPVTGQETLISWTGMVADHMQVRVVPGTDETVLRRVSQKLGGHIRKKLHVPDLYLVALQHAGLDSVPLAIGHLKHEAGVILHAEPDYVYELQATVPNDPLWTKMWALQKIGMPSVWDHATGSSDVVVGVLDTGVDLSRPFIATVGNFGYSGTGSIERL